MDPSNHIRSTNGIKIQQFSASLPPLIERVETQTTTVVLSKVDCSQRRFQPLPNPKPCQLLMGNRYARYVCLIPLDSLKCHLVISSLALTAWLTTRAKGSLCAVSRKNSRAHFSCGSRNLSSRQQLKYTDTGRIEQRWESNLISTPTSRIGQLVVEVYSTWCIKLQFPCSDLPQWRLNLQSAC